MSQTISGLSVSSTYTLNYYYNVDNINTLCHIEVFLGDQSVDVINATTATNGYVSRSPTLAPTSSSEVLKFDLHTTSSVTCDVSFDAMSLTLSNVQTNQTTT